MDFLINIDITLFEWINQGCQNTFFDWLLPIWRNKMTWVPFYILLIIYQLAKFKLKGLYVVLALAITVGIADLVSSKVIKPTVKRLRPCKTEQVNEKANLLVKCGSGYSFTSSHAANHFALAVFLILTLVGNSGITRTGLLFWAGLIAFAQVYVGVHFPFDVVAGALLGSIIAYTTSKAFFSLQSKWGEVKRT